MVGELSLGLDYRQRSRDQLSVSCSVCSKEVRQYMGSCRVLQRQTKNMPHSSQ